MNNFNPDQNTYILSSSETQEGGTGAINGQSNQAEQVDAETRKVVEGQERQQNVEGGDEAGLDATLEGLTNVIASKKSPEEHQTAITTPENELDAIVQQEVDASKPKFEVGEDGLSLQGAEIQGIQSQIQQLESGQVDLVDSIKSEITESRQAERDRLESEKSKLESKKSDLEKKHTTIIREKYKELLVKAPYTTVTFEEFTQRAMSTDAFREEVEPNESALQDVEAKIKDFDTETQTLIETAIQKKLGELKGKLELAEIQYKETGAEAYDKPILLERAKEALEQRLSNTEFTREVEGKTEFYISNKDLEEIFALYGYVDGMDKIKQLKKNINVYNGSEQTETNIQRFAGTAKEKELEGLRDKKNTLQKELEDIEGDTSYQEASHLEKDGGGDKIKLNLLREDLGKISCEVRLTGKGFELQKDYKTELEEITNKFNTSTQAIQTELDRLQKSINNIRALRDFKIPEGRNMKRNELREIEDYLEKNKSKSRWNPSRDQDAISRLSPILENIKLRIAERDEYLNEYNSKNTESLNNATALQELNEKYSQSEYIRGKLGQTEITAKNSITQAINKLQEYIAQYQKPDDFDTKQVRVRELREEITTISKQEKDLERYNPRVIYT
jgi:chromosome segregation ATPase